jgi:hypothetical protein
LGSFNKLITPNFHIKVKEESCSAAFALGNFAKSRKAAFVAKVAKAKTKRRNRRKIYEQCNLIYA